MAEDSGKKDSTKSSCSKRKYSDKRIDLRDLTDEDKQLARELWLMIEHDNFVVSTLLFKELFDRYPYIKLYFSHLFGNNNNLQSNTFRNHMVNLFMPSIRKLLWSLDDINEAKAHMEGLGIKHKMLNKGINLEEVEALRRVFIIVLREYLGSHVNDAHMNAMDKVMKATFGIFADQLQDVIDKVT